MRRKWLPALLAAALLPAMAQPVLGAENVFADVLPESGLVEAVSWCWERGLMHGVAEAQFDPNGILTRAMAVTILHRTKGAPAAGGVPTFYDVPAGEWYSDAVAWASENGVMWGYGDGVFGLEDPITREQLALILWRDAGAEGAEEAPAADREAVSEYAAAAVDWAVGNAVMTLRGDGRFAPGDNASRGETAHAFYSYLTRKE